MLLALFVAALGCVSESPEALDVPDTEVEGLSREQIEQQAEPMTLEEAERLGIVDTTIRIEPPVNPDSVIELPISTDSASG